MNDLKDNKDIQVMSKKNWLKDRIDEGLVFLKANVRGEMLYRVHTRGICLGPRGGGGLYVHRLPLGIRAA